MKKLVKSNNELGQPFIGAPNGTINDQVSGYSLGNIQNNYLKHCYSQSSMVPYMKAHKPTGVTNAQIDLLMSYY